MCKWGQYDGRESAAHCSFRKQRQLDKTLENKKMARSVEQQHSNRETAQVAKIVEKWKTEVFHEFPQSFLLLLSRFSALISRVRAVTFYHLPPIANVFVAVSARKCVKGCTRYAPASQLAAHRPEVKEHISWQLPGCIRCDNLHPAAALPSSRLFYLLILSPARLCWAHTCLNVGQGLLTQGFGCVLFLSISVRLSGWCLNGWHLKRRKFGSFISVIPFLRWYKILHSIIKIFLSTHAQDFIHLPNF